MLSVIIPTRNAARWLNRQLDILSRQTLAPAEILVADSASEDGTPELAAAFPRTRVIPVDPKTFDHGGTRSMAARQARGDILVFLTQDAIPANEETLARLVAPFATSEQIAACYGRQLPHADATPFAAHLRLFNYPDRPEPPRFFADRARYGLHTVFCSNSCAAYRREILERAGWFPERLLFGEDTFAVAKMLELGYAVRYVHDALVLHSHNYSLPDEMRRYFDIGAFHAAAPALLETYGTAGGAGRRFVVSELRFLAANGHRRLLPVSLARSAVKFLAYKLGRNARFLPPPLIRRLSMRPDWWRQQEKSAW